MGELFAQVLERGPVRDATGDAAWLRAMLAAEAALARAAAAAGVIEASEAEAIVAACARVEDIDVVQLGAAAARGAGNPAAAVAARLRELAGPAAHRGATSQDIVDTAAMLVARDALDLIAADLRRAADRAAALAREHRDTPMAGRTLLQQAVPTTFGLRAAGWMTGLDAARTELERVRAALPAQLGGAAGTLASLGTHGVAVATAYARELGLAEPALPWHTERTRIAQLAGALGGAAAACAKPALDVILLSQTEVGEVRETGSGGGSSAMPHKRNPIAAVAARGSAARAPGLVATLLTSASGHEHERAAGLWHAEWLPLIDLLRATGSAAAWLADCLDELEVDAAQMAANLDLTDGRLLAEHVTSELTRELGAAARDAVTEAARTADSFADALLEHPALEAHLDLGRVSELLDPAEYLGSAAAFVDRALAARPA